MNIDATTGLVNDFHKQKALFAKIKEVIIDCCTTHLIEKLKQFLLYGLTSHLFVHRFGDRMEFFMKRIRIAVRYLFIKLIYNLFLKIRKILFKYLINKNTYLQSLHRNQNNQLEEVLLWYQKI